MAAIAVALVGGRGASPGASDLGCALSQLGLAREAPRVIPPLSRGSVQCGREGRLPPRMTDLTELPKGPRCQLSAVTLTPPHFHLPVSSTCLLMFQFLQAGVGTTWDCQIWQAAREDGQLNVNFR